MGYTQLVNCYWLLTLFTVVYCRPQTWTLQHSSQVAQPVVIHPDSLDEQPIPRFPLPASRRQDAPWFPSNNWQPNAIQNDVPQIVRVQPGDTVALVVRGPHEQQFVNIDNLLSVLQNVPTSSDGAHHIYLAPPDHPVPEDAKKFNVTYVAPPPLQQARIQPTPHPPLFVAPLDYNVPHGYSRVQIPTRNVKFSLPFNGFGQQQSGPEFQSVSQPLSTAQQVFVPQQPEFRQPSTTLPSPSTGPEWQQHNNPTVWETRFNQPAVQPIQITQPQFVQPPSNPQPALQQIRTVPELQTGFLPTIAQPSNAVEPQVPSQSLFEQEQSRQQVADEDQQKEPLVLADNAPSFLQNPVQEQQVDQIQPETNIQQQLSPTIIDDKPSLSREVEPEQGIDFVPQQIQDSPRPVVVVEQEPVAVDVPVPVADNVQQLETPTVDIQQTEALPEDSADKQPVVPQLNLLPAVNVQDAITETKEEAVIPQEPAVVVENVSPLKEEDRVVEKINQPEPLDVSSPVVVNERQPASGIPVVNGKPAWPDFQTVRRQQINRQNSGSTRVVKPIETEEVGSNDFSNVAFGQKLRPRIKTNALLSAPAPTPAAKDVAPNRIVKDSAPAPSRTVKDSAPAPSRTVKDSAPAPSRTVKDSAPVPVTTVVQVDNDPPALERGESFQTLESQNKAPAPSTGRGRIRFRTKESKEQKNSEEVVSRGENAIPTQPPRRRTTVSQPLNRGRFRTSSAPSVTSTTAATSSEEEVVSQVEDNEEKNSASAESRLEKLRGDQINQRGHSTDEEDDLDELLVLEVSDNVESPSSDSKSIKDSVADDGEELLGPLDDEEEEQKEELLGPLEENDDEEEELDISQLLEEKSRDEKPWSPYEAVRQMQTSEEQRFTKQPIEEKPLSKPVRGRVRGSATFKNNRPFVPSTPFKSVNSKEEDLDLRTLREGFSPISPEFGARAKQSAKQDTAVPILPIGRRVPETRPGLRVVRPSLTSEKGSNEEDLRIAGSEWSGLSGDTVIAEEEDEEELPFEETDPLKDLSNLASIVEEDDQAAGGSATELPNEDVKEEQEVKIENDIVSSVSVDDLQVSTTVAPTTSSPVTSAVDSDLIEETTEQIREIVQEDGPILTTLAPVSERDNEDGEQKVLGVSTATEVSLMYELCYRGRCIRVHE